MAGVTLEDKSIWEDAEVSCDKNVFFITSMILLWTVDLFVASVKDNSCIYGHFMCFCPYPTRFVVIYVICTQIMLPSLFRYENGK
jgi:hypothetical protein